MASAACPECHIMLVSAEEETWNALGAAVNYAAAHGASEISNSYGLAEETCGFECAEAEADWNHPGIFVSVSSGDYGYDNEYVFGESPSFPAALPTVAAIGGTALKKAGHGRGFKEKAWGERGLGLGTGSGCSSTWAKPAWQKDTGCAGRMTNDVAAVGACATPVSVYDSTEGGWIDLCGTSVSSPLVAGIEAHASAASRALPGGKAFYTTADAVRREGRQQRPLLGQVPLPRRSRATTGRRATAARTGRCRRAKSPFGAAIAACGDRHVRTCADVRGPHMCGPQGGAHVPTPAGACAGRTAEDA